jgi:geranylgeranyl diphosphate synthase type I
MGLNLSGPNLHTTADSVPADLSAADLVVLVNHAVDRAALATHRGLTSVLARSSTSFPEARSLIASVVEQDGGKYVRPRLAATTFYALGGSDDALLDVLSAAIQSLHIGLCIHDDLIDGDLQRHGRPNLASVVQQAERAAGHSERVSEMQGRAAALLGGDLAINASLRLLSSIASSNPLVAGALVTETLSAIETTIIGEALDVRAELKPFDAEGPLTVAELKTATYSIALPLRLGAIAAGVQNPRILEALNGIGRHLGIAYQLVDDQLGLFGDPALTGKSNLSDLQTGKHTELIRLAFTSATADQQNFLRSVVGRPSITPDEAHQVRAIVESVGALDRSRALVSEHTAAATALAAEHLPTGLGSVLTSFAERIEKRDH